MTRRRFALHLAAIVALVLGVCVGLLAQGDDAGKARAVRARLAAEPGCEVFAVVRIPGSPAAGVTYATLGYADPATVAAVAALVPDTAEFRRNPVPVPAPDGFFLTLGGRPGVWVGHDWVAVAVAAGGEPLRVENADPAAVAALYARLKGMPRPSLLRE